MSLNIKLVFAWYDLWVGVFYDRPKQSLYILPVPCLGIKITWGNVSKRFTDIYDVLALTYCSCIHCKCKCALLTSEEDRGVCNSCNIGDHHQSEFCDPGV